MKEQNWNSECRDERGTEASNWKNSNWEEEAQAGDRQDDLAALRAHFYVRPDVTYMDGNSLGLLSRPAENALLQALETWKTIAIDGWMASTTPWFFMAETLAAQTAPLVGAAPDEISITNSTTVNLHQLIATLYTLQPERRAQTKILADALNFPSDLYALQSQLRLRGLDPAYHLVLVAPSRANKGLLDEDAIVAQMSPELQIALLPSVVYTSGQLLDIAYLTRQAHQRGILIGFDCSHSIGALPHTLDAHEVDFAFWCSYKYLCGGPGASGGLYLNRRHFGRAPGLAGWFSSAKERQFAMTATLEAAPDAGALQIGTPNILSMAPLQGALELIHLAGIDRLRSKSLALTEFLMRMASVELAPYGVTILTPRASQKRGGHVALQHPEALRICKALRNAGIVPDYRPPDIIRFAPVALYTSFSDCYHALQSLKSILENRAYETVGTEPELVP